MTYLVDTWTKLPADEQLAAQARAILTRTADVDGVDALSEQFVLGIDDGRLEHVHLLALIDGHLAGFAAVNGDDVELVVDPEHRRRGVGSALVAEVRSRYTQAGFWAHGNLPQAKALAEKAELSQGRRLLVMKVSGAALTGADAQVPAGYVVRNLAEAADVYGREEAEKQWLKANNEAFDWHPEQGGWNLERLHRAQEAAWYSDEDVLLLWENLNEPALAGFHWTKWQPGADGADDHQQGEVYVVGLASAYRGRGLGGPIVEIGLAHLVDGGAKEVILYVEEDNVAAVRRYEKIGFEIAEEHVVYS